MRAAWDPGGAEIRVICAVLRCSSSGSLKAGLLSVRKVTFHFFLYLHRVVPAGVHAMQVSVCLCIAEFLVFAIKVSVTPEE